jgi:hypothetical protein
VTRDCLLSASGKIIGYGQNQLLKLLKRKTPSVFYGRWSFADSLCVKAQAS